MRWRSSFLNTDITHDATIISYFHTTINTTTVNVTDQRPPTKSCFFHVPIARRKKPSLSRISSQQFLMTTILEEPYMMLRKAKPGELLRGNDRYEGYCKVRLQYLIA